MYIKTQQSYKMANKVSDLIEDMKIFVNKHILSTTGCTIVDSATSLSNRYNRLTNLGCCVTTKVNNRMLLELDYWHAIVILIQKRIECKSNQAINIWCGDKDTYRYLQSGLPVITYPSRYSGFFKYISFILLFASAVLQIVRSQIDAEVSFWSQLIYIVGALAAALYFYVTTQYELILPQLGNCCLAVVTVLAVMRHQEAYWSRW